ncbi:hypothetical protein LCGC14_2578400, partial [marine sediment metagenome]
RKELLAHVGPGLRAQIEAERELFRGIE